MAGSLKNDDKSIRSYILNDVLEKVPIDKSYENLCKVIGNDAITFYDFQYWYYRFLSGKQDLDFDRSSEPEPLQFSDLPVDAVRLIVKKVGVMERLMLRKVSKPLREFIEKQDFDCPYISVSCGNNLIDVSYRSGQVMYAKNEEAVKLYRRLYYIREPLFIYGDDYESEAFNELAWILKRPKIQIERLDLSSILPCSGDAVAFKCYNIIKVMLKSLKHQISVKKLDLQPEDPDDVLAILPYLKSGYLEEISIKDWRARHDWRGAERKIQQIIQLEQWKQAKELVFFESLHLFPDEVLVQFKKYWIQTWFLPQNELVRIGNKFAASPVFEYCRFDIKYIAKVDDFIDFIGVAGPTTKDYRSVRHHMIPNTDKMLVFKEFTFGDVEIEKKTRDAQ